MALEFTITSSDHGVAVLEIAGTDGADVSVQTMQVGSQWPVMQWSESGSRSGDGEVTVNCGPGVFWFAVRMESGGAAWTAPKYVPVGDGKPARFDQIIEAVVAKLRLLSLDEVDSSRIIPHMLLTPEFVQSVRQNTILVAQWDGEQPSDGGPTSRDRYGFNVAIALAAPANRDQDRKELWNKWRDFIRRAFNEQWLVVPDGNHLVGKYFSISGPIRQHWEQNCYASIMGLNFTSEEFRGLRV